MQEAEVARATSSPASLGSPNTLLVPNYNRFDGALYYTLPYGFRLQANVQNLSAVRYYTLQNDALFPGAPVHAVLSLHWTRQHER